MKYMGSKRFMLKNGLGRIIKKEVVAANRFIDIFAGTGSVASHVAENYDIKVKAFDLQLYSTIISGAIIKRNEKIEWQPIWENWYKRAKVIFDSYRTPSLEKVTRSIVNDYRSWASKQNYLAITKAYGGHYYSPKQAVWIDALRTTLPEEHGVKATALAALIQAASQCAAAPGHTAQPFQPTKTAKFFIKEAWEKDIVNCTKAAFISLANHYAMKRGTAVVADANKVANRLQEGDLVFIDPPYSGVHYSRFYHVLETIAHGNCGEVTGKGRYPDKKHRPVSKYSLKKESKKALDDLLHKISKKKANAILTFPDYECSNGLSGDIVRKTARKYFDVEKHSVESKFSTLGGRGDGKKDEAGRDARRKANELILVLKAKEK
jgi:adenine-specific DNA methylase